MAYSDLVASVARRVAHRLASPDVQILEVPEELADTAFDIELIRNRRTQADAAAVWLRQEIQSAVGEMR
ncbi:hypothetical protein [Cupriavidus sp. YAF13]|uniref:hypothetical protein n=1 Tax=Cupriavidus sp. YAF13 TaxID=3233075 RepID=UPI003F8FF11F